MGKRNDSIPATRAIFFSLSAVAVGIAIAHSTAPTVGSAGGRIESGARALIERMSVKLAEAGTLEVRARRKIDPGILPSGDGEVAKIRALIQRPNKVHVTTETDDELRELVFDGEHVGLVHRELGHYAYERLAAKTIAEFSDKLFREHGFQPPIAELLAGNSAEQLLSDIRVGRVVGPAKVEGTPCTHAVFQQAGMQWDIWLSEKDGLPRRLLLTFFEGKTLLRWDITFDRWRLGREIDPEKFVFRVPVDFARVTMVSSDD